MTNLRPRLSNLQIIKLTDMEWVEHHYDDTEEFYYLCRCDTVNKEIRQWPLEQYVFHKPSETWRRII